MDRIYNFSAGPSMLPVSVLERAASEMLNYNGSGMSVMEMSHRSAVYQQIIDQAEADLRKLMNIPDNYKVLFLQGGATTQFSAVPLNLMTKNGKADYIVSGQFSGKAAKEAERYGEVRVLASSKDKNFTYVPYVTEFNKDSDYVHICYNNTIFGTVYPYVPQTGEIPLVADMSSGILSKPINVSDYALIYAGAQKNMAPAGMTLVIIREDLIGDAMACCPDMLRYKVHAENGSMYNTPPCYTIYVAGLVYQWLLELGGLEVMQKINEKKAGILYDYLDNSKLFKPTAEKECRSLMNVCFVTGNPDMDKKFISEASAAGFSNLKGHRVAGGMRASIYNAMPTEGVEALVAFMEKFEKANA
ncbi:MAG: 3-phosphoserine/phosphohydroxythreonine transaminase [Clostridia bacterium]|jgi:phosphoserine aminotransferase|nr:3-phosphoserine/phosphohydroxythreonine transaminase [Clostridia bacterium]MBQ5791597.1 3-phosphoserine/phosphohydroxythreonine transaminase [Clostridia bacterium]